MGSRLWRWVLAGAVSGSMLLALVGCGSSGSSSNGVAPPIPHAIQADKICKDCHATGQNGALVVHDDRGSCLNCHTPTK